MLTSFDTERLRLVPMTLSLVDAELEGRLAQALHAELPPDWPPGEHDHDALVFFRRQLLGGAPLGWGSHYVLTRDERPTVIAAAGFHGPPDEHGVVEIGYSIVEHARGRGYATEVVLALVEVAFESGSVQRVVARTHEGNAASIAVLVRCGFTQFEASGDMRGFERTLTPTQ